MSTATPAKPPLLALTMGDPCGIGPETIACAVAARATGPAVVVGDVAVLRRAVAQCGLLLPVARVRSSSSWARIASIWLRRAFTW